MNRRDFFAAVGAVGGALALGSEPVIRRVMFAPPSEPPHIYWMHGHVAWEKFVSDFLPIAERLIYPEFVKHGWATRKMDFVSIYISDRPLENFVPITYWIPADQERETFA